MPGDGRATKWSTNTAWQYPRQPCNHPTPGTVTLENQWRASRITLTKRRGGRSSCDWSSITWITGAGVAIQILLETLVFISAHLWRCWEHFKSGLWESIAANGSSMKYHFKCDQILLLSRPRNVSWPYIILMKYTCSCSLKWPQLLQ